MSRRAVQLLAAAFELPAGRLLGRAAGGDWLRLQASSLPDCRAEHGRLRGGAITGGSVEREGAAAEKFLGPFPINLPGVKPRVGKDPPEETRVGLDAGG